MGKNNYLEAHSGLGLGMKWFIFFTRIIPVFAIVFAITSDLMDFKYVSFLLNYEVFGLYTILNTIYVISFIINIVIQIVLFIKSNKKNEKLLRFIRFVLIYNIFFVSFSWLFQSIYSETGLLSMIITEIILIPVISLIWYYPNMKYFKKRLDFMDYSKYEEKTNISDEKNDINIIKTREKICLQCGSAIDNKTKICTGCGANYSRKKTIFK